MSVTQDYGADQVGTEEVRVTAFGIPSVPGKVDLTFHETGEIVESVDTFDTPDGQAHTVGRSKASKDWTAKIFANRPTEVAILELWLAAVRAGKKGHKLSVTVTYLYADGTPGRKVMLHNLFPVDRKDPGSGSASAAAIEWKFKYQRATPIKV